MWQKEGSWVPVSGKCGRNHSSKIRDYRIGFFMCGQDRRFMKECPMNNKGSENPVNRSHCSLVDPPDKALTRGVTSSTGVVPPRRKIEFGI